jgi:hypothetical protein
MTRLPSPSGNAAPSHVSRLALHSKPVASEDSEPSVRQCA